MFIHPTENAIIRFLDNDFSERHLKLIREHVAKCEKCQKVVRSFERVKEVHIPAHRDH